MRYETFFNPDAPQLTEFRKQVLLENGGTEDLLRHSFRHREVMERFPDSNGAEDLYKFSKEKWEKTKFHSVEACLVDDRVVSISTCTVVSPRLMRILMFLYTLKDHRKTIRGHVFSEDGFFARHVTQARALGLPAVFLSVYPHSRKLEKHAANLGLFKRSLEKAPQPYLDEITELGTFQIQNVAQHVFAYRLAPEISWKTLEEELLQKQ